MGMMNGRHGRLRASLVMVASASALLALAPAVTASAGRGPAMVPASKLWSEVNPVIGTAGGVDLFPGPDVPFGMMQWSPDTSPSRPIAGGYSYDDSRISGFSLTHLSGAGCGAYGDVPILPYVGDTGTSPANLTAPFSHSQETVQAGYYSVVTGSGDSAVQTQLTDTARAGLGQFTFPASAQSQLVFKLDSGTWSGQGVDGTTATVVSPTELTGSDSAGRTFCGHDFTPDGYTLHFSVTFSQPFTASTTYGTSANGGPAGVILTFDTTADQTVTAKIGISYVSTANAAQNAATEIPGWNLDTVRDGARRDWDRTLSKIQIAGGSSTQQVQFYTALYHALLAPSLVSDDNGQYLDFGGQLRQAPRGHAQYGSFSGWDIYRSQVQLASIVAPHQTSDAITSLLNDYAQSGELPRWALENGETYVTAGDPADPIIADAFAFGARDFNARQALSDMVAQATQPNTVRQGESVRDTYGYLPYDAAYTGCCNINQAYLVSTDLEFGTADHAIASLAGDLGNSAVSRRFATRAQDWQNDFNPATGYMQAKQQNGQWLPGFTPGTSTGFEEGTSSQYTPMVPYNLKALIAARGGGAAYSAFLDGLLQSLPDPTSVNANLNDEPSMEIPWEYDYTGEPYKTQQIVREAQQQLYFDAPAGQFGNDDLGAMSSWFVWSDLGFYPETPGTGTLVIGSPVFPLARIHLANSRIITIRGNGAGDDAPYVHTLTVNGSTWSQPWLTYADLSHGATLSYTLSAAPDPSWGSAPSDAPPSDGTGERPDLAWATPSALTVQPGMPGSASVQITSDSASTTTVTWHAAAAGISIQPAQGRLRVRAGSTASVPVTVTAGPSAPPGTYAISIAVSPSGTGPSSQAAIPVTVSAPAS